MHVLTCVCSYKYTPFEAPAPSAGRSGTAAARKSPARGPVTVRSAEQGCRCPSGCFQYQM